jgi:hypothetical protein
VTGAWLWWPTIRRLTFGFRIRWKPVFHRQLRPAPGRRGRVAAAALRRGADRHIAHLL